MTVIEILTVGARAAPLAVALGGELAAFQAAVTVGALAWLVTTAVGALTMAKMPA